MNSKSAMDVAQFRIGSVCVNNRKYAGQKWLSIDQMAELF